MSKFEQLGVNAQMESVTINEARSSFAWSCRCCCNRNMKIDCDHCAIRATHYNTLAIFNDLAKLPKSGNNNHKHGKHSQSNKGGENCTELTK